MYLDLRGGWLESARFALQAAAYPLQLAVNSPSTAWQWVSRQLRSRASLQRELDELRRDQARLQLRVLQAKALEAENAQLRGLQAALPSLAARWLPAEIISSELTQLKQRLVVNRGTRSDVFVGQPVLSASGILGQTTRVGPFSSEVILITDPEHAIPVQVLRNGLRTIAVGDGSTDRVLLPYLPVQSDIEVGDTLVSSGLGGVYPAGYPVAKVSRVERAGALATVVAETLGAMDRYRAVALVWYAPQNPAAPVTETAPTAQDAPAQRAP
jgi:rod shape-determining protein MreC